MLKSLITRIAPRHTRRRLAATLVRTLLTQPGRLRYRLNSENLLLFREFSRVRAHCCICGQRSGLYYDMPDLKLRRDHAIGILRETLECKSCGSTSRQRTLAWVLTDIVRRHLDGAPGSTIQQLLQQPADLAIWDTDAFSPLNPLLKSNSNCILSKYIPDRLFGQELEPGVFNVDLQRICFDSNRFDIILSSDIMEHVRDDRAAHREIFRCLRPGGTYIFTVPYREELPRTLRLVDSSTPQDILLTAPHYHGDPLSGGILAYRIYGRDLIDELQDIGFEVRFQWIDSAEEGIFGGDCFIATKPRSIA